MGAGEPGMLSPSPPTHGPLARAAGITVQFASSSSSSSFFGGFLMGLYRALRGCSCGSRGFLEDRLGR